MIRYQDIYSYIQGKENEYLHPVSISGWNWSMKDHLKQSFYYKHGRLVDGMDIDTPVKNITRPILNLQYRAEDIDIKDIVLYVDDPSSYHLSFLIKKYHDDVYVIENDLDTFIDETNESKVDYGISIIKKLTEPKPETIDMLTVVFADQTDAASAPLGIKHYFNPASLKEMEAMGWGDKKNGATITVDELIELSVENKEDNDNLGRMNQTTGANIEIYEVHGVLPQSYLDDSDRDNDFVQQMQIVAFYKSSTNNDQLTGAILFRKEEKESPFKILLRDKVSGRAVGFGGAEELFDPQIWTNYDIIRIQDMLDSASKTILKAIGVDIKSRYPHGLKEMENLQVIEMNEGEDLAQVDTFPRNMVLFENSLNMWEEQAQTMGSAQDPLLGKQPPSGATFRGQERVIQEGKGIHEYRRGKYAKFLEEVWKDWIIPHIVKEITKGMTFLSELDTEEMQFVVDAVVKNQSNNLVREKILSGEVITEEEVQLFEDEVRRDFIKGGNKKFLKILKGEFKKKAIRVKINIAGKQKDLQFATDRIVNLFRQIFANPEGFQQVMQMPGMAKSFNDILEFSGLSPAYFTGITDPQAPAPALEVPEIRQPETANV